MTKGKSKQRRERTGITRRDIPTQRPSSDRKSRGSRYSSHTWMLTGPSSSHNDREGNSCFSFKYYPEHQYLLKVAMYFRQLSWYHKGTGNLRKEGTNIAWHCNLVCLFPRAGPWIWQGSRTRWKPT